jgi:hypothetical protein
MRYVRALGGLTLLAAISGCSKGSDQSRAGPQAPFEAAAWVASVQGTPGQARTGDGIAIPYISSQKLITGSIACLLNPVVSERGTDLESAVGGGRQKSTTTRLRATGVGLTQEQCELVARAVNLPTTSLSNGEPSALAAMRRALDGRLSVEGATSDNSDSSLAFFDNAIAAAREARRSSEALFERVASPNLAVDVRASDKLSDLYLFGLNLGTSQTGIEAQTLAWIIGVDRFMWTQQVPGERRSAIAEPFFTAILNVPEPAPTVGRATPTWNEYLATAARAISSSSDSRQGSPRAIGGGPSGTNEEANLHQIARVSEERLKSLGQKLPVSSALRMEADVTAIKVRRLQSKAEPR